MEDYQRALVGQMAERIDLYDSGETSLPKLVEDLHGLFEAADPRRLSIRDSFMELWAELDAESELRTAPWMPPGLADDARLREILSRLRSWIESHGPAPSDP
ncbi:hypothetical protein ACFOWE_32030 [Planomonospora corallina]|uniref:CdiI immunity protein domain-containing protein n=1 Tax=Planomonospora corallina TaxID=1806052 RepID=A0ABV8IIW3_9ACTN